MKKRYLSSLVLGACYLIIQNIQTDAMLKIILDKKFIPINKHIENLRNPGMFKNNKPTKRMHNNNLPISPLVTDTTNLSNTLPDVITYRKKNNNQITIRVNKSSDIDPISSELTNIGNLLNEVTLSNNKN